MMTATLRNWGGSIALPIPKFTLKQLMQEHKALALPRDAAWLDFDDLPAERV